MLNLRSLGNNKTLPPKVIHICNNHSHIHLLFLAFKSLSERKKERKEERKKEKESHQNTKKHFDFGQPNLLLAKEIYFSMYLITNTNHCAQPQTGWGGRKSPSEKALLRQKQ